MTLTIHSNSQFNLYCIEPSRLRVRYKVDLDEVHDAVSNAGFDVNYCPKERKTFLKNEGEKLITGWDLAILNATCLPFKTLKEYITNQITEYINDKAELERHIRGEQREDDLFEPFMEPRILIYRKCNEKDSKCFLKKFIAHMKLAFKTTFTLFASSQEELNKIIVEILNLRKKNRVDSN